MTSTLALALFAFADANVFPFAWPSARYALVTTVFCALGVAAHLRFRENAWTPGRWLAPFALGGGLLGGEGALGGVALVVAYELVGPAQDRGIPWAIRVRRASPFVAIAIVYLALYALSGGGAFASAGYISPLAEPGAFARTAAERIPTLLADAILAIPADVASLGIGRALAVVGAGATILFLLFAHACARFVPAEDRTTGRWLASGGLVSLGATVGGFPGARELIVANLAFAPILAIVLRYGASPGRHRALRRVGVVLFAVVHLGLAPAAQVVAERSTAAMARATEAAARSLAEETRGKRAGFIVASSDAMVGMYAPAIVATAPKNAAATSRCIAWLSGARADMVLTRTGVSVITLAPNGVPFLRGPFESLFRSPRERFSPGDEAVTCGVRVRVLTVTDGLPARIEVSRDDYPEFEDAGWVAWTKGGLVPVALPPIGQAVTFPWAPGPSEVF